MKFNPSTDFLDVHEKFKEIKGGEVTRKGPIVVAFYVSRWLNTKTGGASTSALDLSLQWVGQLLKSDGSD